MKKYIFPALAAALLLTGCREISEGTAVDGTMPSLTALPMVTEAEQSFEETEQSPVTDTSAEVTALAEVTEVGGEPEEKIPESEDIPAEDIDVESISLTFYSVSLQVGERKMPIVAMSPADASDKSEIWESSDPAVAAVDSLGNITAVSEGSCTVRVTSAQNPDVFAEVEVTVTAGPQLTYFQGILIVNKTYALPADYAPGIQPEAQAAFDEMQADAAADGLNIYISSGFRSYDYQAGLYQRYVDKDGKAEADRYSARAGHSEHQTGLAFDLNSIEETFAMTWEGEWVKRNCYKYGFIIRYPADKEDITGYKWEPWHIRYLGKETAQAVYDSGLCLEEYLGITSEYAE